MKSKKLIALLMTSATIFSLFTGCGSEQISNESESKSISSKTEIESSVSSEGSQAEGIGVTFPLEEPVEFDVVVCGGNDNVYELKETLIYKYMEERTNVKLNVTTLAYSEYDEKVNLMINSGEYPDAFIKASGSTVVSSSAQGILLPLEDLIEKYAPNYSALIDGVSGGWSTVTFADGHQYSFYGVGQEYEYDTFSVPFMYINTKWLENLNLEMPNDPESFYEVMKAFKEQDADGDGNTENEVPLIFAGGNIIPVEDILPYFGMDINGWSGSWARTEDGQSVEYYAVTERYKEVLAYLTKLYQEGIMHKDSLILTHTQVESMAQTGTAIGCFFAWDPQNTVGRYDASLPYEENLVTQYEVVPPWDGAKATSAGILQSSAMTITDKCKNPEILVAWVDLLYSDETTLLSNYGIEGDTYDLIDGKIKMRDANNPSDTYGEAVKSALLGMGGGLNSPAKLYHDDYGLYYDTETNPYINYVKEISKKFREEGLKYEPFGAIKVESADESAKNADILADAEPYRKQYRAEVITGEKELDATWDEYIKTMDEMGIQTVIESYNAAYQKSLNAK